MFYDTHKVGHLRIHGSRTYPQRLDAAKTTHLVRPTNHSKWYATYAHMFKHRMTARWVYVSYNYSIILKEG